jgi:hypothetical protein
LTCVDKHRDPGAQTFPFAHSTFHPRGTMLAGPSVPTFTMRRAVAHTLAALDAAAAVDMDRTKDDRSFFASQRSELAHFASDLAKAERALEDFDLGPGTTNQAFVELGDLVLDRGGRDGNRPGQHQHHRRSRRHSHRPLRRPLERASERRVQKSFLGTGRSAFFGWSQTSSGSTPRFKQIFGRKSPRLTAYVFILRKSPGTHGDHGTALLRGADWPR